MWPFSKKTQAPTGFPQKLPFKDGESFLEYQCKYGFTEIRPKQGVVALVLDSAKEFGAARSIALRPDGVQQATLKVASSDGGFIVASQTASGKGDRLRPGDVVIWVPLHHMDEKVPAGIDKRFGWVGFIVAKVKPEIDLSNPEFDIVCRYA